MAQEEKEFDPKVLEEIREAIAKMKYGEVVITVHDSRVVQIEERQRKRLV